MGRKGHVGTFDWHSGRLHTEIQLKETCRAIRWLHDESFFAVAQKQYVYIYDKSGLEVHQLRNHLEVTQMEFLPYHFLLATVVSAEGSSSNVGVLKLTKCWHPGQRWFSQISRHVDRSNCGRTPYEIRRMRHDGTESSQRVHQPWAPEWHCHTMVTVSLARTSAIAGSSRASGINSL